MLDKVREYLKKTGNTYVEASDLKEGVLHTEIALKVKNFTNVSKIAKSLDGLPFYVHCAKHILVERPEEGIFRLIIPHKDIKNVKFEVSHILKPTQIYIGMDEYGNNLLIDLAKITHSIIAGATGSGKSMVIHSIIHSLLASRKIDISFLDPKRVESQMYAGLTERPDSVMHTAASPSEIEEALSRIHSWMEERYIYMAQTGIRDAMESWISSGYTDDMLRPMVLIVDEVADLFSENKNAKSRMLVLSSKARAAGLRIFLATQRPDAKIIDGAIKANFTTRICLKTSSSIDSNIVLGFGGAENLRGNGHGILLKPNGEIITFKGALLDSIRLYQFSAASTPKQAERPPAFVSDDIRKYAIDMQAFIK